MATRYPVWSKEQTGIEMQYEIERVRRALGELTERINSLQSLGKLSERDREQLTKSMDSIRKTIERATKKPAKK